MIVNLVIVALLLLFMIFGIVKGFLKQVLSIAGTVLAFVLAAMFCNTIVDLIKNNTGVYTAIYEWLKGIVPNIDPSVIETYPAFLQEIFAPILNEAAAAAETVADTLTRLILSFGVFLVIVLIVKIVVLIVGSILKAIVKAAALGGLDRFLGAIVGLAKGLLFVSALLFITEILIIPISEEVAAQIDQSVLAKIILDLNIYGWIFKLIGLA